MEDVGILSSATRSDATADTKSPEECPGFPREKGRSPVDMGRSHHKHSIAKQKMIGNTQSCFKIMAAVLPWTAQFWFFSGGLLVTSSYTILSWGVTSCSYPELPSELPVIPVPWVCTWYLCAWNSSGMGQALVRLARFPKCDQTNQIGCIAKHWIRMIFLLLNWRFLERRRTNSQIILCHFTSSFINLIPAQFRTLANVMLPKWR